MEPILLKSSLNITSVDHLIYKGVHDMDINQDKREEIQKESSLMSDAFTRAIQYHLKEGKNPNASYAFNIAVHFNNFIEEFRKAVERNYKNDVLVGFGIGAIWMGIINGLDAESGIMPNHPFKREIANCLKGIVTILEEVKANK